MTQRDSLQKDHEPRRFDVTLVGDTSLDLRSGPFSSNRYFRPQTEPHV